jgi:hypothetical protein
MRCSAPTTTCSPLGTTRSASSELLRCCRIMSFCAAAASPRVHYGQRGAGIVAPDSSEFDMLAATFCDVAMRSLRSNQRFHNAARPTAHRLRIVGRGWQGVGGAQGIWHHRPARLPCFAALQYLAALPGDSGLGLLLYSACYS